MCYSLHITEPLAVDWPIPDFLGSNGGVFVVWLVSLSAVSSSSAPS